MTTENIYTMQNTEAFIQQWIADGYAGDVAIVIGDRGGETYRYFASNRGDVLDGQTLFDMMSVTKIMATAPLFHLAMGDGRLSEADRLGKYFPEAPADKADIPLWMLLAHCSGIPRILSSERFGPDRRAEYIANYLSHPLLFAPGEKYEYSCGNFVLLGFLLERVYNMPLDLLFDTKIARPLGLTRTGYLPAEDQNIVRSTRRAWEGRLKCSDPINRALYGVSGNAGIFSCIDDMARFGQSLLNRHAALMREDIFAKAAADCLCDQEKYSLGRGLGYVFIDDRYDQNAGLFANGSIGHTGFSGTAVYADFANDLFVVSLSNTAYYANKTGDFAAKTSAFRRGLHGALARDLAGK